MYFFRQRSPTNRPTPTPRRRRRRVLVLKTGSDRHDRPGPGPNRPSTNPFSLFAVIPPVSLMQAGLLRQNNMMMLTMRRRLDAKLMAMQQPIPNQGPLSVNKVIYCQCSKLPGMANITVKVNRLKTCYIGPDIIMHPPYSKKRYKFSHTRYRADLGVQTVSLQECR